MPVDINVSREPDYVELKVTGSWTEETGRQVVDRARHEAEGAGKSRILLDLLNLDPPTDEMIRYYTGTYLAQVLPPPYRTSSFSVESSINRFCETVAVNRGALVAVFSDRASAVEWLLSDARP